VLAAAVLVGACDDTAGLDSIDDAVVRDMAIVAADATLEEVNTMGQPFGFRGGGLGFEGGRPGGHRGLGADGSGTTEETFYDADGNIQDAYDELTTDRIDVVTVVNGEVAREDWSAVINREREMTITGLAGEEAVRTLNGTGTSEVSRSRHTDDGDRTYEMSGASTHSDVVVPIPGSDPRYPLSGTITRSMTSTRTSADGTETRSMEMTITFDGDETAVAVVNGETVEIDLSAREGRRPFRGRFGGG
jgi:hypothetical protein